MGKDSFILYDDMAEPINSLSDEQAGRLIKHIFAYRNNTNWVGQLDSGASMAFSFIKGTMERNERKYKETCEKNRSNAIKRWSKEKGVDATAYDRMRKMRTHAMDADSDSDPDPDSEPERDIEEGAKKRNNVKHLAKNVTPQIDYSTTDLVIDYLNKKTGKNFRHSDASRKYIYARLSESYTYDDCKKVIDIKYEEWSDDDNFSKNLNTKTLFRPENFERYLNQKTKGSFSVGSMNMIKMAFDRNRA